MKKWIVIYRPKGIGRNKSHGLDSKEEAVKFIVALKKSGDRYSSLKIDGNHASPSLTIELDRVSDQFLAEKPN
jgi:hypothetical protein